MELWLANFSSCRLKAKVQFKRCPTQRCTRSLSASTAHVYVQWSSLSFFFSLNPPTHHLPSRLLHHCTLPQLCRRRRRNIGLLLREILIHAIGALSEAGFHARSKTRPERLTQLTSRAFLTCRYLSRPAAVNAFTDRPGSLASLHSLSLSLALQFIFIFMCNLSF